MSIEDITKNISERNKDLALYAKHVLEALDHLEEYHRRYVAAQALAGIKPSGGQEQVFYDTLSDVRKELLHTLEWTIEDLRHKGDKYYTNHFKDGVE
ncbi:hypothetical protein [Paenibacillus alkalitolerans]|uniref:hypothetical protein n=1 Tax=Paenibacillus alkalitolerans TaxID=2799335 RepID=UPI0018F778BA|nr:hypothetical protein [Paenibacillus alkalitolerans]